MFRKTMIKLDGWIGAIGRHLLLVCGSLILLMAFAQTYGVIMRKVINNPDSSAYELSMLFLLFSGVLAFAGVEKLDQNVKNDLVSARFPPWANTIVLNTVFPLLALCFCAVLTWKSLDNAIYALQIGQVTQSPWALPLAPIKLIIPLGYTLLCLVLCSKIVHGVMTVKTLLTRKKETAASEKTSLGLER